MGILGLLEEEELPIYRWEKTISLFWWQEVLHSVLYVGCWHFGAAVGGFLCFLSYSFNGKWQWDQMLWIGMGQWDIPVRILQYSLLSFTGFSVFVAVYGSKIIVQHKF